MSAAHFISTHSCRRSKSAAAAAGRHRRSEVDFVAARDLEDGTQLAIVDEHAKGEHRQIVAVRIRPGASLRTTGSRGVRVIGLAVYQAGVGRQRADALKFANELLSDYA